MRKEQGRVKGCTNERCVAKQKKITYKESDAYCSKCGNTLSYVCKGCYTFLPDATEKHCVRCLDKREERKQQALKMAGSVAGVAGDIAGAAGGVAGIAGVAVGAGKKILKVMPKFK